MDDVDCEAKLNNWAPNAAGKEGIEEFELLSDAECYEDSYSSEKDRFGNDDVDHVANTSDCDLAFFEVVLAGLREGVKNAEEILID